MPTDCFELLHEERRPWVDTEALKSKFLKLSAEVHPDRVHGATDCEKESATKLYASLNAAYNTLREPKDRLLHLMELELGERPKDIQRIPPGTMDLFVEIGQVCRDVDAFIAQRPSITSPMLCVQQFAKGQEWVETLQRLQKTVNAKRDELGEELKAMNSVWESTPAEPIPARRIALQPQLERIEQIYRVLSYVQRWTEQLQQRVVELAAG